MKNKEISSIIFEMETKAIVGQKIDIQSYKHDGSLHRTWKDSFIVENNEQYMVCVNDKTKVFEADGRKWVTREPAIYFLYYHKWFNIIAMMRKNGIYYYCNIATPCVVDQEAIKNIDYDLDVKVLPNNTYQILDENEYALHYQQMGYNEELDQILHKSMNELIEMVNRKDSPFNPNVINQYYQRYIIVQSNQ